MPIRTLFGNRVSTCDFLYYINSISFFPGGVRGFDIVRMILKSHGHGNQIKSLKEPECIKPRLQYGNFK